MKSRIPSVWRSIRELWWASGGPWCSCLADGDRRRLHQASPRSASARRRSRRGGDVVAAPTSTCSTGLSVIALDLLDQALLEPLRLLAGEGRDQDLVDPVVLDRVLDRGERLRAHRLAGRVDLGAVHLGQGAGQALADLLARDLAGARADERVAVRSLLGALLEPVDELRAVDGLGRDDERVGDVPAHRVVVDPDRDVGDRGLEASLAHSTRSRRRRPKRVSGRQEIRISSGWKARTASSSASSGSGSKIAPSASMPNSARTAWVTSKRYVLMCLLLGSSTYCFDVTQAVLAEFGIEAEGAIFDPTRARARRRGAHP